MTKKGKWYHIREIENVISHWTTTKPEEILYRYDSDNKQMKIIQPEELIASSKDHIKHMLMTWNDNFIYDTEMHLNIFVPLMRYIQELVKEEAVNRRKKEKLLTE